MEEVRRSFFKGAVILTIAGFVSKVFAALYRIPYQNLTGDVGMYVYQQVYPLYSLFLILATVGFPVAISKMVSERVVIGDTQGAKQILRTSSWMLSILGCVSFFILFFSAEWLAEWMGNREMLTLPIQAVSFALLITPLVASLRGYFQGHEEMMPTAVSQVLEQLFRVVTVLASSWFFIHQSQGLVWAASGAMFGAFTGGLMGLLVLLFYWHKGKNSSLSSIVTTQVSPELSRYKILKQMWWISIPICLSSLVWPLISLVDSFSVANQLVNNGWSLAKAITMKGVFDRGQPLIQFAAFFATALSLSIVPAIATAIANQDKQLAWKRAMLTLRFTVLMGFPASIGLAVIAMPTNVMLYKDALGSDALAILACTTLFSTLSLTLTGILQGAGKLYAPVLNLYIGVVVKMIGNYILIPLWDIRGAALSTVIAYVIACSLNLYLCKKYFSLPPMEIHWFFRLIFAGGAMGLCSFLAMQGLSYLLLMWLDMRLAMTFTALITVFVGMFVYVWIICLTGLLSKKDLQALPKGGKSLIYWLERGKFIPKGES